ncbi:MAG: peptidase T, partial [Anaerolineaceae bacterium]|nr:peptidase T [Anaerolineaceae bacterium]
SPDFSGANVNPQFHENYDGGDIVLNKESNIVLSPRDFPELLQHVGETLITTDGTTLLGSDDKAGVAEIMTALDHLIQHPEIVHGTIKVGFTPDEEVGRGIEKFDVKKFAADFAYTVDGGEVGHIEYENFNAAGAMVTVHGRNVHPGTAKDKMINSILIASEFNDLLPASQRPMYTTGYEGFFHLYEMQGTIEKTSMTYIIRDHDPAKFEHRKALMNQAAVFINEKYGAGTVIVQQRDQYRNMKELILPVMHIVDTAKAVIRSMDIEPVDIPIRGGTDGAGLSYMGLPTPNLFTGGMNMHGKFEYIPVESMQKAVQVIVKIIERYAAA